MAYPQILQTFYIAFQVFSNLVFISAHPIWQVDKKYDLVWASHVLEHQQNVGLFLQKLINLCNDEGYIAITVPFLHRRLWGGHLSLWTPGFLAYNIVLQGIDLSRSQLIYGFKEISVIFKIKKIQLPRDLTYDSGDIKNL